MERPRIALVLDKPQRDLPGLVLTAVELCQHGAECFLVPASLRRRELFALAPDYVLLYNFRRGFEGLVAQLADAGIRVGALDTEGGVWPELRNYTELLIADAELRRRVHPVFAWGPKIARHVVDEGIFSRDQVRVTGCPRFDLYHPRWGALFADAAADAGAPAAPPRILVNTNFSEANPSDGNLDAVRHHLAHLFGWPAPRIEEIITTQQRALALSVGMARALAEAFPAATVVLRPHPFEGRQVYLDALAGLPNVEFNLDGPVLPQIRRAAATVQRTSTTAVESAIAGVPALVPLWIPAVGGMPVVEAVSVPCAGQAELTRTVAAILEGRLDSPEATRRAVAEVVRDGFAEQDGLAYRRVAAGVLEALDGPRTVSAARCRRNLHDLAQARRPGGDALARLARYALGLSPEWSFRRGRAVPVRGWRESDSGYDDADVRPVAARAVEVERAAGRDVRPVAASLARAEREYLDRLDGVSVKLAMRV